MITRIVARILLWAYIRLIRSWTSPLMSAITLRRIKPNEDAWLEYKHLPSWDFEKKLSLVKCSGDPLGGLADYTIKKPEYFWAKGIPNVDCDDVAYMWFLWSQLHCDESWLVVIMDGIDIESSHYFTVVRRKNKYHLCNYRTIGEEFKSLNHVISAFSQKALTHHGIYKNIVFLIDKHWKQKKEDEV